MKPIVLKPNEMKLNVKKPISSQACRGYIEGYYGQLLGWNTRSRIVRQLKELGFSHYLYAPKEDVYHRLHWRRPYPAAWRDAFAQWANESEQQSVRIIAGVAPGLDFDFSHLPDGADFIALVDKAKQLLDDGASDIALLMDDINTDFNPHKAQSNTEGQAHAQLANALGTQIGRCIYVVPRVYAQELENESPGYAAHFCAELDAGHVVFHSGTHIVSPSVSAEDSLDYTSARGHRVVVWDNLYANDYCPRRLYVGCWAGRDALRDVMLNPTGMPATDALLLDIMALGMQTLSVDGSKEERNQREERHNEEERHNREERHSREERHCEEERCSEEELYTAVLQKHGVPNAFSAIAAFFSHPPFAHLGVKNALPISTHTQQLEAIEQLLWKWKTPLSREWYPYLFGLKHDLLIAHSAMPELRIKKTQLSPLADTLLEH